MTEAVTFELAPDERDIFLQEVEEHLQVLDEDIIRLEREGDDPTLLQEIFRAAHTLKGASATIGHQRMADLTHGMETVLDGLRKGTLKVSPSLTDLFLEGLDLLRSLQEEVVTGQRSQVDIALALERFREVEPASCRSDRLEACPTIVAAQEPRHPTAAAQESFPILEEGTRTYEILAQISKDSLSPAIRALQVVMELGQVGDILHSFPTAEEINAQKVGNHVRVILASREDENRVLEVLEPIMDLEGIEVHELEEQSRDRKGAEEQGSGGAEERGTGGARELPTEAATVRDEFRAATVRERRDGETRAPESQGDEDLLSLTNETKEERELNLGPIIVGLEQNRRKADLGPKARGKIDAETVEKTSSQHPARSSGTVRITVERLDNLVNLIGELITYRNRLFKIGSDLVGHYGEEGLIETLREASSHIGSITDLLQTEVMKSRMFPLESVFNKFPRLVRDLARKAGKEIELVIQGQETELDRSVIEVISDPLIHLLRNYVDHGIETLEERRAAGKPEKGTIRLTAYHEEGHIVITVEDNGKGIDPRRLKEVALAKGLISQEEAEKMIDEEARDLLFLPGLSTAKSVSEVSGRGVGMDVVKTNIERVGGSVVIQSEKGQGSHFEVHLPLTLAILPTLLVSLRKRTYLIPLASVIEIVRVSANEIKTIQEKEVIQLRGHVLPLVYLGEIFGFSGTGILPVLQARSLYYTSCRERYFVVVIKGGDTQIGLVVDSLLGQEEVVMKSLGGLIGELKVISGATILGDGRVGLILDVMGIIEIARRNPRHSRGSVRA